MHKLKIGMCLISGMVHEIKAANRKTSTSMLIRDLNTF